MPGEHQSVLGQASIEGLRVIPDGCYIDATFGRGGHSGLLLSQLNEQGRLLVLDRDPEAIAVAQELAQKDSRVEVFQGPFSRIAEAVAELGWQGKVDGVLFDLGVSSPQLDDAERGFSFLRDGPLDMRMDPSSGHSAAQWINSADEGEIADVIYRYGEERHSRRMARFIVAQRKEQEITTTAQLAELVKEANPSWEKDKHPATRAFQAIRIYINNELDEIEKSLEQTLELLAVGGRMAVISFHSLEDRIVKRFFAGHARGDNFPRDLPIPASMLQPKLRIVGKPRKADHTEVADNPRARSAVLRVAEKLEVQK